MAELYRSGVTLNDIGLQYGITRERVRQIITKYHGLRAKHGGAHKAAKKNRIAFNAKRDAHSIARWGCPYSQYVMLRDLQKPTRAYAAQRRNSIRRGIEWKLTLWQWWCVWQDSGFWEQRGRGNGYQMCRIGDQGPYSVGNVYIATGAQNMRNYWAHVRTTGRDIELRRFRIRQYYYRRKFREAGMPEDQIPAEVARVCPGLAA
jgi:hypothetical protein